MPSTPADLLIAYPLCVQSMCLHVTLCFSIAHFDVPLPTGHGSVQLHHEYSNGSFGEGELSSSIYKTIPVCSSHDEFSNLSRKSAAPSTFRSLLTRQMNFSLNNVSCFVIVFLRAAKVCIRSFLLSDSVNLSMALRSALSARLSSMSPCCHESTCRKAYFGYSSLIVRRR